MGSWLNDSEIVFGQRMIVNVVRKNLLVHKIFAQGVKEKYELMVIHSSHEFYVMMIWE